MRSNEPFPPARSPGSRALRAAAAALALSVLAAAWGCSDDGLTPDTGIADAASDKGTPDSGPKPDGPRLLEVGEFLDFVADSKGTIDAVVPTRGNEKLILLLLSLDFTPLKVYPYVAGEASTTGGELGGAGADKAAPASGEDHRASADDNRQGCFFQRELERILASKPKALYAPSYHRFASQPPKVGDTRSFNVSGQSITAKAIFVDSVTAFWVDQTTQPVSTIDPTILKDLADGLAKVVVPRERTYFGQESDLDNDGHISVLFSPLVTATGAIAFVSPCDLLDPKLVPACSGSNQMEVLYSQPTADLPSYMATATALLELIAHELQHAIYFYRKYMLNNYTLKIENPYITEGLSDLAVDLSGYNGGLIHRRMSGLDGVDLLSVPNLTNNAISAYVTQYDGEMRGGIDLLVRYMWDLAGGDTLDSAGKPVDKGGIKWLRSFVDSKELGEDNFLKSASLSKEDLVKQFWTALAVSNRGPNYTPINKDPIYNFLPQEQDPTTGYLRGLNLFGSYKSTQMKGPQIQSLTTPDGKLRAGGGELLQTLAKGSKLRFLIKTDPAAKAMVRLIRTL